MSDAELRELMSKLSLRFPRSALLSMLPSAGPAAWRPFAERFPGGPARRWFAAWDGQADELPFWDGHSLGGLAQAAEIARECDALRAEPDGYWVQPSWISIGSDLAGHHLMIDDADGRVLSVAHDDDHVVVLAPSPEAWLAELEAGCSTGTITWEPAFGLIFQKTLDEVAAWHARPRGGEGSSRKLGVVAVALAAVAVFFVGVAWLVAR